MIGMSTEINMSRFLNIDGESPMRRILPTIVCLLLAACVTETTTVDGTYQRSRQDTSKKSRPAPTGDRDPGDTIKLPPEVMQELISFVNRKHFLIADRIEVDASRVPFHSSMVPVNDDRYVETLEMEVGSSEENAVGMLIRSRSKRPLVERDRPRLRIGDGLELVAGREIRIRTYSMIDRKRPVFIRIQGVGHAVYRDEQTGERIEKDAIAIRAEVVEGKDGPQFRTQVL